ncbi:MAG: hypothetical protein Q9205_001640 [Flavoplaca limonia]
MHGVMLIWERTFRAIRQLFQPHPPYVPCHVLAKDEYGSTTSGSEYDDPSHEKRPTTNVQLEQRADEPTELYGIYPKDVTDKSQADAINQLLDQYVLPANKTDIYASECNRHSMWTLSWNAPLTEFQAEMLKQNPNIGYIGRSDEFEYDPYTLATWPTLRESEKSISYDKTVARKCSESSD